MSRTPSTLLQSSQNRKLFTSNYVAGTTDRIYSPAFPRSNYRSLFGRLSTTLTKTETAPGVLAENVLSLIRGIRIKADGDTIKEFEPTIQRVYAHHISRRQDTNLVMATLGTDAAEPVSARFAIDFATVGSKFPEASLFPGDRYSDLAFEVDWGSPTDLVGGGTYSVGPVFGTAPTLEIWGEEILDPAVKMRPFLIQKQFLKTWAVSSTAQTGASFPLPVGETYRGIALKQLTRNPDLPITTLVTSAMNIVLKVNGSFRKLETTWGELIQRNQAQYGIALPAGYAFIDFMEGGDFRGALQTGDAVGVSSLELIIDTASVASAFLQVMPITFKAAR